ncbi:MAG: DUF6252 family protein [Bacteroidota bacterium]
MKSLFNPILFVLISFSLISIGCSDEPLVGEFGVEPGSDYEDPNADATFQVELNGELFVSEKIEATIEEDGFQIKATADGEIVQLFLPNPTTDTYAFSQGGDEAFISYNNQADYPGSAFYGTQGSVTVTSFNSDENIVSGEFDGTLTEILGIDEDINMTNGVFQDIVFVEVFDDFDFGEVSGDFMTALIDGDLFDTGDVTAGPLIVEVEEEGEDGEEGETTSEVDPSVTVVRGRMIIDLDLPEELPEDIPEDEIPTQLVLQIKFTFDSDINPGMYDIGEDEAVQATFESGEDVDDLTVQNGIEGMIDIQEMSGDQIQGQFEFTTEGGITISSGAFRVSQ